MRNPAALRLHSPEVQASENELQDEKAVEEVTGIIRLTIPKDPGMS